MDDLGASSKQFEIYSRSRLANLTPLKRVWPWKAWGPYRELTAAEIHEIVMICKRAGSRLSFGVTACWVDEHSNLTPYHKKFPEQAAMLQWAVREGFADVVNHGYTHCRVGKHLPRWCDGNREQHREYVPDMSMAQAASHLLRSQQTFREWLVPEPSILVPPGLLFADKFLDTAKLAGLRVWNRKDEERCVSLHDKDIVEGGWVYLRRLVERETFVTCGEVIA